MKNYLGSVLLLVAVVCGLMVGLPSAAQEGDFLSEGDDFDFSVPPPPPQVPNFNNPPQGNNGNQNGANPNFPPPPSAFPPPPSSSPSYGGGSDSGNPRLSASKKRNSRVKFSEAGPEDINDENFPDLIESFDYPNAEITDVIKAMSELTGKNFILDNNVRGKITIMAPTRITVAEAYKAFLSALAINNLTIVPSGKFLKVVQASSARQDSLEVYTGAYAPATDQMITRIIQLKHISSREVGQYLRQLISRNGLMDIYEPTNTVIVTDLGSNVDRIFKIIQQIDAPGFDEQLSVIPIRHAKSADIADLIDQIINKGQGGRKGRGQPLAFGTPPRFGEQGSKSQAFSLVIPDERTNSIIVVGNNEGIKKIKNLVRQLDFNIPPEEAGGVFVYYVQHGNSEELAKVFQGIQNKATDNRGGPNQGFAQPAPNPFDPLGGGFGGSSASGGAVGGMLGANVKISSDKDTNSLIIVASKQDYETVRSILKRLDIPRDQVYVQTIIMEMLASTTNKSGFNYYYFPDSRGISRGGFVEQGLSKQLVDITSDSGTILGFGSGSDVQLTPVAGGPTYQVKSLMGFVNFLKSTTNVNILSTPEIMALDNAEAFIEVGDRVPTSATTTNGANGTTQTGINFEDATTKIKITPNISKSGDTVRMKVEQTVKSPSTTQVGAKNLTDNAIVLNTRNITSNIVLNNGDTAVIGGLMRDRDTSTVTKVPLLGDLPLIGWFFRNTREEKEKTNLVVFITPKIIRNSVDHAKNTRVKLAERLDFIKEMRGGTDKYGARFDSLAKKVEKKIANGQKTSSDTKKRIQDNKLQNDAPLNRSIENDPVMETPEEESE